MKRQLAQLKSVWHGIGRPARASRQRTCVHCGGSIPQGIVYASSYLKPWDHVDNEGFFHYQSHLVCDHYFHEWTTDEDDWTLWEDYNQWRQYLAGRLVARYVTPIMGLYEIDDHHCSWIPRLYHYHSLMGEYPNDDYVLAECRID